ncbi:Phosphatidylinositol-4-phosphate 5-kinase [Quaeritorhiza haematococci]|nr:Phosphatidylinositol-4-phosphate 5-kinase [Quaeritorhiza haematococci]
MAITASDSGAIDHPPTANPATTIFTASKAVNTTPVPKDDSVISMKDSVPTSSPQHEDSTQVAVIDIVATTTTSSPAQPATSMDMEISPPNTTTTTDSSAFEVSLNGSAYLSRKRPNSYAAPSSMDAKSRWNEQPHSPNDAASVSEGIAPIPRSSSEIIRGSGADRSASGLPLSRRHTFAGSGELLTGPYASTQPQPKETAIPAEQQPQKKVLRRQKSEKEVLVGTPVKEGHVNFMLMYDMLTGIRISVSRCNAKPLRPLTDADFAAAHKLAFDVTGNEMTPSSKYDFKFKDYAPWVFRMIRESFRVDPAEYLLSLTGKYVLSELGSPGKSGSFFYFSQDYRFIIKTVHHSEHKFLRKILKQYYEHIRTNPNTLLSRIFGLHRVKLPGNRKIHFVVMGNVFPANKDIHEVYDLKGSTIGRMFPEEEAKNNPRAVLKDLNWEGRKRKLELGPHKRGVLVEQMEKDVTFLVSQKIMDYSLLVGIHDMVKGNKENIRDNTLSVYEPNPETLARSTSAYEKEKKRGSRSSTIMRKISDGSDGLFAGTTSGSLLPDETPEERRHVVFYQDQGGFQATNEEDEPLPTIYYVGIIDIFTKYDATKKIEHFFKSLSADKKKISAVNPIWYGARFLSFMKGAIKGFVDPNQEKSMHSRANSAQSMGEQLQHQQPQGLIVDDEDEEKMLQMQQVESSDAGGSNGDGGKGMAQDRMMKEPTKDTEAPPATQSS